MIDFDVLRAAINKRHHAIERFFDIEYARRDLELNLEMLARLENGMASREDEDAALQLLQD